MLTQPLHGWSDFQLEGTSIYSLSYLDDIALTWVQQAIYGLETMLPFCVKGYVEPNRFLCTVSYWNCHILCEDEERYPFSEKDVIHEVSHTSMLQFCQYLYDDFSAYIDEWACFTDDQELNIVKRKQMLLQKLDELKTLIIDRNSLFDKRHSFI